MCHVSGADRRIDGEGGGVVRRGIEIDTAREQREDQRPDERQFQLVSIARRVSNHSPYTGHPQSSWKILVDRSRGERERSRHVFRQQTNS